MTARNKLGIGLARLQQWTLGCMAVAGIVVAGCGDLDVMKTKTDSPNLAVISGRTGVVFPPSAVLRRSLSFSDPMSTDIYAEVIVPKEDVAKFAKRPIPGAEIELKEGYEPVLSIPHAPPWYPSASHATEQIRALGTKSPVGVDDAIELFVLSDPDSPQQACIYLHWSSG